MNVVESAVIYVLRHAKAEKGDFENIKRPLGQQGHLQAQRLAPFLQTLNLSAVYTSPFQRAISTVEPFCVSSNLLYTIEDELREGVATEPIPAVQERISSVILAKARLHPRQSILLCTHGGVFFGMLSYFNPALGYEDYLKIRNPDIRRITFQDDSLKLDESFIFDHGILAE